jgi:DNA-binding NarL/FixJ family response regulator
MMKIMIADDSLIVRQRLMHMLNDLEGIEVVGQADDAPAAMELMETFIPDVAILDIRMPTGSGADLVRKIKRLNPASKIIVLTSFPYPEVREKCISGGADFFFDKSNGFQKIVSVIRSMVRAAYEKPAVLSVDLARLSEKELECTVASLCASYGTVEKVSLHLCRGSPLARPFAMVNMVTPDETERVAAAFGRRTLGNSAIVFLRQSDRSQ